LTGRALLDYFGELQLQLDMLRKILLIVAIIAGLAAAGVNFTVIKGKIDTLTADRNQQRSDKETAQHDLAKTKKTLKDTQAELEDTKTKLADAVTARQKAEDKVATLNTQIQSLNDQITKISQDRDNAQDQLEAYKSTGLTPKQVADLNKTLQQTQNALDVANQEKFVLTHTVNRLQSQLDLILGKKEFVVLPAGLKGTVMAVDPKWNFIVLNIGDDQGVLQNGELLVSRDGKLVAKVIVSSVQKDRCIANLVPGWQLGDIIEGDTAIPAHPST
jgi:molecular chaperone GrpE (heat shock protein)